MKNWEGEKIRTWSAQKMFAAAPLYSSLPPPTHWGHMPFLLSSWGHACCDHSESYSRTIICRHCVDQQTDSLVFTEFQSDHWEWSHWKVGGQRSILAPLHRNLEEHSPSLPYSLFHPWPLPNESSPQKRAGMARVLKGSILPTHPRSSAIGMSHTCLYLPCYSWYSGTHLPMCSMWTF